MAKPDEVGYYKQSDVLKVDYRPEANQLGCDMRSRKLALLHETMSPVNGEAFGRNHRVAKRPKRP